MNKTNLIVKNFRANQNLTSRRAFVCLALSFFSIFTNAADFSRLHQLSEAVLRDEVTQTPGDFELRMALVRKLAQTKQSEALLMLGRIDKDKLSQSLLLYYEAQACEIKIRMGNIQAAKANCEAVQSLLPNETNHPTCSAIGANALGTMYSRQGKPALAIDEFERGLGLLSGGLDEALRVAILHNRGVALTLYGLTDLAIEAFEDADRLKNILPEDDPLPTILAYNLGYLQAQRGEHEAALKSYAIVTEWLNATNQYARAHIAATEVALSLSAIGRYQDALDTLAPWMDRKEAKVTPDSQAQAYLALGNAHLGLGNINAARDAMQKGIEIARESGNPVRLRELSLAYATTLLNEGSFEQAVDYLEQLIDTINRNETNDGLGLAHELLANAFSNTGEFRLAWENSVRAAEIQSIAQTDAFNRRLASLRISNELDVKDQQLALALEREAAAITSKRLAELIQIATVTGVLIALIVTYLLFSRRQKQQEASIQKEAAEQLEIEVDIRTQEAEVELERRHTAETERADLEVRLLKDDKLRSIGQLTGGVAHDFNNLMTVVLLSAEMLEPNLNDEQKKLIQDIIAATQSGRAITRGLLAYARQQTLTPTTIELGQYLRTNLSLFRQSLDERIAFSTNISDMASPLVITADPGQLTTCLLNLVINARESIRESGSISIRITQQAQKIAIAVTDTGSGMSEKEVVSATEPFYTTKEVTKGAGLGLSMVEGFVNQSGGTMNIQSTLEKGTTITLLFDESEQFEAPSIIENATEQGSTDKHILLVEDEPGIRDVANVALTREGYTVTTAASGDEASVLMRDCGHVDLLITDLVMPGELTGEALIEVARIHFPGLPVILMSGYATDVPSGFSFLPKPFSLHDLKTMVIRELSRSADSD